jgi:anthranilate phosphoribosyltransferase
MFTPLFEKLHRRQDLTEQEASAAMAAISRRRSPDCSSRSR